jgi:hypothetical protein
VCNQGTCVYFRWPPSVVIGNTYHQYYLHLQHYLSHCNIIVLISSTINIIVNIIILVSNNINLILLRIIILVPNVIN